MPIIKSAIKKVRQDKKRREQNLPILSQIKNALKFVQKQNSQQAVSSAYSLIDRAVKKKLIHPNKAARLKSRLGKLPIKAVPKAKIKSAPKTKTASKKKKSS